MKHIMASNEDFQIQTKGGGVVAVPSTVEDTQLVTTETLGGFVFDTLKIRGPNNALYSICVDENGQLYIERD